MAHLWPAPTGHIPCPPLIVAGLPPISSISKAPALFPTGKKLGNVALSSEGEGAILCPSKDSIVTETQLGCLSPLSPLPFWSPLSDAKF